VVRGGDDDGVDGGVVQDAAEVGVGGGVGGAGQLGVGDAGLVDVADGGQLGVGLLFEIGDVAQADEAAAEETEADAIVGAEDAGVGSGAGGAEKGPAGSGKIHGWKQYIRRARGAARAQPARV
jgi:hypothetical protein